jgi:hypothetical protein
MGSCLAPVRRLAAAPDRYGRTGTVPATFADMTFKLILGIKYPPLPYPVKFSRKRRERAGELALSGGTMLAAVL